MGQCLWSALALLLLCGPTAAPDLRDLPRIWDPDTDDPTADGPISNGSIPNGPISHIATPLLLSARGFAPPHSSADPIEEVTSDPIDADSPPPHKLPILKDDNGDEELKVEFLPVDLGPKGKKRGKRSAGPIGVDPIRVKVDPTDPVRVKVGPVDPIRVGVDPTGPTGVKVDPLANVDPIRVGVDPIDPIRVGVDPIRARTDPLANIDPIGVGADPTDPIRARADPTDPIRVAVNPTDPIRPRTDPLANVDPTDPIRIGIGPTDPIGVNPLAKAYPIVTVERFGVADLSGDPNLSGDISGSGDTDLPTTITTATPKTPNPITTSQLTTAPQQGLCHNGGVYINGFCHCTPLFYGVECEYAKESVEVTNATVSATVTMSAQVLNRAFSPALENPKSPEFTQFQLEFQEKMKKLYGNVEGYEGVEILSLREGSVVVTYDVLLRVATGTGAPTVVEDLVEDLLAATVANCSQCSAVTCDICFNTSHTSVTNYTVQPLDAALCQPLIPPSLIGYYSAIPAPSGALCVSRCHPLSDRPFPCVHGACAVSGDGPRCHCSDSASFWYVDASCSSRLSKMGLALGLPLAVIGVGAAGCGVALLRTRRQRRADREKLRSHSALYSGNEEEETWGGSAGFAATNRAASWEELEASNGNYISLRNVGSSKEVRIQRPQIVVPP